MERLTLAQLSERTGVSEVKLRRAVGDGFTWRNWFLTEFPDSELDAIDTIGGVYAVLAAYLSDIGCSPEGIRQQMNAITAYHRRVQNPLHLPILADAISSNSSAVVQVGEGTHVKWRLHEQGYVWHRLPTLEPDPNFDPAIVLAVDVAKIRDRVRGVQTPRNS